MGSKALKIGALATGVFSPDPITGIISSTYAAKKLYNSSKSSSSNDAQTAAADTAPKQGDTSYEEVNDVKSYTPSSTQENYGYGTATDTNSLLRKRRPLGS